MSVTETPFSSGYILSLVLLTLPRQHLVQLYLYVLTALLLFAGHQLSRSVPSAALCMTVYYHKMWKGDDTLILKCAHC